MDLSQMLKSKSSKLNLDKKDLLNKFTNLKLPQVSKNNTTMAPAGDPVKLRAPKPETTRKIQESLLTSKVNKKEDLKNTQKSESVLNKTEGKLQSKKIADTLGGNEAIKKKSTKLTSNAEGKNDINISKTTKSDQLKSRASDSKLITDANDCVGDTTKHAKYNHAPAVPLSKTTESSMSYYERHIVNVLHTKVLAHPNGFFANNLPNWFEMTFEKKLPANWLDLLRKSEKCNIEEINTKVVIYAIEEGGDKASTVPELPN